MFIFVSMLAEKTVSFREFARMTGTSDGGVRKAVGAGRILEGVIGEPGKQKIIPSIASFEWGKPLLPAALPPEQTTPGNETLLPAASERAENFLVPVSDLTPVGSSEKISILDGGFNASDGDTPDDIAAVSEFSKKIAPGTLKPEAERLISVFKAQKAQRELLILEGEYVPAKLVYGNLLEMGNMIRDNFINVPEQVVDDVRAADTRNEAVIIMKTKITSVLTSLSKLETVKLSNQ